MTSSRILSGTTPLNATQEEGEGVEYSGVSALRRRDFFSNFPAAKVWLQRFGLIWKEGALLCISPILSLNFILSVAPRLECCMYGVCAVFKPGIM